MELGGIYIPTWLAVVIPLICYWLRYSTKKFGAFRALGIKGPMPIPGMGSMHSIQHKGLCQFDLDLREKYGDIVGTFQGRDPVMVIYDKDLLKQIMVKDFQHFQNRFVAELNDYGIGKMLTQLKGDHWKHVRATLTPAFSSGRLRGMTAQINRCALVMVSHLDDAAKDGTSVEVKERSGAFTMDAIASTAFGLDIDSQNNPNNEFVRYAKQSFDFSLLSPRILIFFFLPFLSKYVGFFPRDMQAFFTNAVNQAMDSRKKSTKGRQDFLQIMVNAHQEDGDTKDHHIDEEDNVAHIDQPVHYKRGLTHEETVGQGFLFFIAGYETTANTIAFTLYNLACNPDKQDILIEEIDKVMESHDDPDYELVREMKYLGMVVDETLRMFPPAARSDRVAEEDVTINGVYIPKDMIVGIPAYALHHDPEVWPEPKKFIPERFTQEEKQKRHPCSYIPFGMGPRSCIAMRLALLEVKIVVIQLLRRYRFAACDKTQIPIKLDKLAVRAEKGIHLTVNRRS